MFDPVAAASLRAFDSLPKWLREALAASPYPWDAGSALELCRRYADPAKVLAQVSRPLPDVVAQSYGPAHPQAQGASPGAIRAYRPVNVQALRKGLLRGH